MPVASSLALGLKRLEPERLNTRLCDLFGDELSLSVFWGMTSIGIYSKVFCLKCFFIKILSHKPAFMPEGWNDF